MNAPPEANTEYSRGSGAFSATLVLAEEATLVLAEEPCRAGSAPGLLATRAGSDPGLHATPSWSLRQRRDAPL